MPHFIAVPYDNRLCHKSLAKDIGSVPVGVELTHKTDTVVPITAKNVLSVSKSSARR